MAGQRQVVGHDHGPGRGDHGIGPRNPGAGAEEARPAGVVLTPPTLVLIGPFRYTLEVDETAINALSYSEQSRLIGCAEHRELRLVVRPGFAPDKQAEIVLHEVLHAINDATGLKSRLDESAEEDAVNSLAPLLLDVLRRNPDLVAYLTDTGS